MKRSTDRCVVVLALSIVFAQAVAAQNPTTTVLPETYKNWLDHEVRWIITNAERAKFLRLGNNEDRDRFILNFWEERNPMPGMGTNPFKQEHYRRLAFANVHFGYEDFLTGKAVQGSDSNRGRVYIIHGRPDSVDRHPASLDDPKHPGYRYEVWHYIDFEAIGDNAAATFVDTCACGAYFQVSDPEQADPIR